MLHALGATFYIHKYESIISKELQMKDCFSKFEDMPIMLSANQLAIFLGISRAHAYTLMHSKGFPTIRIGKRMLCPKEHVITWLEQQIDKGTENCTFTGGG